MVALSLTFSIVHTYDAKFVLSSFLILVKLTTHFTVYFVLPNHLVVQLYRTLEIYNLPIPMKSPRSTSVIFADTMDSAIHFLSGIELSTGILHTISRN